jgi:uncharacterized membrane protein (GlpM family)
MWVSIIIGCAIIIAVGLASSRSPYLSGLLAHIPVKTLVGIWVVYSTGADMDQAGRGMLIGVVGTLCLVLYAILVLRHTDLGIWFVLLTGSGVWLLATWVLGQMGQ